MVSLRRAVLAAVVSAQVADVSAQCMCDSAHPYCYGPDHTCYKDPSSKDWDKNHCVGTCTADFTSNPDEYHYEQPATGSGAAQQTYHPAKQTTEQHTSQHEKRPAVTQADIDQAVQDEKDSLRDAWQAVTDTQAYYSWLQNGGNTAQYKEGVAEKIKTKAFAKVDELRHRVEVNLSSKVTAVSALSAKLATEPGGGTPSEQAQLTSLLSEVEKDRNCLRDFGLDKKIKEMAVVWEEAKEQEQRRMAMLRFRNLETRKDFLRSSKFASHMKRHSDHKYESICDGSCEGVFDNLEQTVEPVQDAAKDQISAVYDDVYERVKHRVELLRKAAAGSGGDSFFLFA